MEPSASQLPELGTELQEHMKALEHRLTHMLFVIGMALKGVFGVLDVVAGFVFFSTTAVTDLIFFLAEHELGEDPLDIVATKLVDVLPYLSVSTELFIAWYFLIHGILNLILVVSVLRKKLWAYPAYMTVLVLFCAYQLFRFTHTHSLTLLFVTFFDVVMVALIWKEYRYTRQHYALH